MNPTEAVKLTRLVKSLCPGQPFDEMTPDAWAVVLDDVSSADAITAVRTIYRRGTTELGHRRIEADEILAQVRTIRRDRIAKHADELVPPAGLSQAEERAWIRAALRELGDGHPVPDNGRLEGNRAMPAIGSAA